METHALKQLMGAYLHQDYDVVGDVWDNVDAFVADSPDLARQLPAEVTWALGSYPTEQGLGTFLKSLGCELLPLDGEGGYHGWLKEIGRRVESRTEGTT